MIPYARNVALERAKLAQLRPTQFSVGYAEVELKAAEWKRLKKKQREQAIQSHVFPAVLGPGHEYYIVDHHHLGIALIEQGVKEVWVTKLDDMSWLDRADLLAHAGIPRLGAPIRSPRPPSALYRHAAPSSRSCKDDPYRSLAGLVRLRRRLRQGRGAVLGVSLGGFLPSAHQRNARSSSGRARRCDRYQDGAARARRAICPGGSVQAGREIAPRGRTLYAVAFTAAAHPYNAHPSMAR